MGISGNWQIRSTDYIHEELLFDNIASSTILELTSCRSGFFWLRQPLVIFEDERLWSHSAQSQLLLLGPRDPILENWPTTGQCSSTPLSETNSDRTYTIIIVTNATKESESTWTLKHFKYPTWSNLKEIGLLYLFIYVIYYSKENFDWA